MAKSNLEKAKLKATREFNQYIRLRDLRGHASIGITGKCISCGSVWEVQLFSDKSIMNGKKWHAGHFWKANQYASTMFHPHNVNLQCYVCNRILSGNESNYSKALIEKIGQRNYDKLDQARHQVKVYTIIEYERIAKEYHQLALQEAERLGIKL